MTVTFLSGPGTEGNHDIDFWVLPPPRLRILLLEPMLMIDLGPLGE